MALTIKSLCKSFGKKNVFDSFSYDFASKGLYTLTGRSGIGKTTLLRIIAGLDDDYEGEILGGGIKSTSFSFQEYRLFPSLSALDNVTVPNSISSDSVEFRKAKDVLTTLGFSERDLHLKPRELSGGMKQRLSLARAIMRPAPILLLDEPTKELDEALRNTVYSLIHEESMSRLVIMVTHNREELTYDDIIEITI